MTTIKKKITDMSIYGVRDEMRWDGSVIVDNGIGISVHGKYFPTKEQAESHADELLKELGVTPIKVNSIKSYYPLGTTDGISWTVKPRT